MFANDLHLRSTGEAWCGTFSKLVFTAAIDILSDGREYGPVSVMVVDGSESFISVGTLVAVTGETISIRDENDVVSHYPIDYIREFHA